MDKILPSLLAGDFANLGRDIDRMEAAGADMFHLDVMDGQFVPNISYGLPVIEAISKVSNIPLDVHLMTLQPDQFIEELKRMGVAMVSFHVEATHHPHRLIQKIQQNGMKAGIALNPHSAVSELEYLLPDLDFVLIMTVNPGFGGQAFISQCVGKITELDGMRKAHNYQFDIEVDGGINDETAAICRDEGANLFVSGSHLFKAEDPAAAISRLRG